MRYIDYARIRNYDIKNLLHYQVTTMSFFFLPKMVILETQENQILQQS